MPDKTLPDESTTPATRQDTGDDAPEGGTVRSFTRAAAQRLNAGADYVRSHDAKRVMADLRTVVTNNPGLALIVAAAGGFLVGRVLSRD